MKTKQWINILRLLVDVELDACELSSKQIYNTIFMSALDYEYGMDLR